MKLEPLSLDHQHLLETKFQKLGLCLSEYSFSSRYLFRKEQNIEVILDGDDVWILGDMDSHRKYLMPTEDIRLIPPDRLLNKLKWAGMIYPIPESWTSSFDLDYFHISYNRNDSDYLFNRQKIAEYPGRNLSSKRNLLKQSREAYHTTLKPYSQEFLEDALVVLDAWQQDFEGEKTDTLVCQEALQLADRLKLSGILLYIDERPVAFILGEVRFPHVFDIQFAKGLKQYKGIYPRLFHELAHHLSLQQISCLNWEDDLGHEGLRQSKLSYQPDKIAHKYRLVAK